MTISLGTCTKARLAHGEAQPQLITTSLSDHVVKHPLTLDLRICLLHSLFFQINQLATKSKAYNACIHFMTQTCRYTLVKEEI